MRQKRINSFAELINAATKCSAGANTYAAALGLVVATKPLIDGAVNPAVAAQDAFLNGRGELKELQKQFVAARKAAQDLTFVIRDSLKRKLGRSYTTEWQGTGFSGKLALPRTTAALEQLLRSLKTYFTQNPANEVPNVATAILAGEALDSLTAAETAVTVQRGVVRTLLGTRRQKEKVLRNQIRGVIEELTRVLGPLDGRWDAFGLNQPGIKQVPPTPGKVTIVLMGNGRAAVKWEPTPRAEYYRVWLKVEGAHEAAVPVGTPADTDFTIENVTAGAKFEVSLSAVNNGGESARSEIVTETMQ